MPEPHPLRLDRSKYHSSVHGEFQGPVRFWQNGLPFDALGQLVINECDAEQIARADRKTPRSVSTPPSSSSDDDPPPLDPPSGDVNLELWAKGEERYLPAKVFAAIRERYSKSVTTFGDAIEFLVNEARLIPKEQASPALLSMGGQAPVREEA
jgi:hypothetical protein